MLRMILTVFLLLNTCLLASEELSYKQDDSINRFFSKQKIKLSENVELDFKIFATLSLVDDTILEKNSIYTEHPYKPTQQFFILSYKF